MLQVRQGRWAALLTALFISGALAQVDPKTCAACHGADGNSAIPGTPSIAAQPRIFLENYLVMTREGIRWINSTAKSIEEIATTILRELRLERHVY